MRCRGYRRKIMREKIIFNVWGQASFESRSSDSSQNSAAGCRWHTSGKMFTEDLPRKPGCRVDLRHDAGGLMVCR